MSEPGTDGTAKAELHVRDNDSAAREILALRLLPLPATPSREGGARRHGTELRTGREAVMWGLIRDPPPQRGGWQMRPPGAGSAVGAAPTQA